MDISWAEYMAQKKLSDIFQIMFLLELYIYLHHCSLISMFKELVKQVQVNM